MSLEMREDPTWWHDSLADHPTTNPNGLGKVFREHIAPTGTGRLLWSHDQIKHTIRVEFYRDRRI